MNIRNVSNLDFRIRWWSTLVFLTVVVLFLPACFVPSWGQRQPPPKSAENIPIYPGAENVETKLVESQQREPAKLVTFRVYAGTDEVLNYYRQLLVDEGWDFDSEAESSNRIRFVAGDDGLRYDLSITVESTPAGQTDVEIFLLKLWGE